MDFAIETSIEEQIKEANEICSRAFIMWKMEELGNPTMSYSKSDLEMLENLFLYQVMDGKLKHFGVNVHIPMYLYVIVSTCADGNIGKAQLILKEILNSIKEKRGPIKQGYVITTNDMVMAFGERFPVLVDKSIEAEYEKLWQAQKREPTEDSLYDNKCDTKEWWAEVME